MNSELNQAIRHRGSSPPFQESQDSVGEEMQWPTPIGHHTGHGPQKLLPAVVPQWVSDDETHWQVRPPGSLWRDDGGESG